METTRIVMCTVLAALGGYVGIVAFDDEAPGMRVVTGRLVRVAARLIRKAGHGRIAELLLGLAPVSSLCDVVVTWVDGQGHKISRENACGAVISVILLSMLLCVMMTRSIIGVLTSMVAWCLGIPFWDAARQQRRTRELTAEMPGVFRTLAMAMASGSTLTQAVEYVGENGGGISSAAFRTAALKLRCGIAANVALGELVEDLDAPGIDLLATALLISQRTGSPLRSLFQHTASLVERQGEFERMLSVKTAQVRLSARIVSLLPPIMVGTLSLISPDFQKGLMTVPGMGSLVVATAMDLLALGIIRRLMKGVL